MKVLTYGLVRAGLFGSIALVLYLAGWWDVFAVIAALVMSVLIAYLALPRLRDQAAQQLNGWLRSWERRDRADERVEDAEVASPGDA